MKRKFLAVLTSAICLAAAIPSASVFADGQKVLTLGADLDAQQKNAILNYFGVNGQNIQTLTITNQDERNHLGSYVPLEQIGTRTYSCALVSPTNSGGIQVKTANLSWVTSNMIASTLSTSGVVNCDVLAAAPFEVSGTGALTGILMAYESAVGATLDTAKKEVATQELITTTTIANNIGQVEATEIVNESKMQVIQGDVVSDNDIDIIINEVADQQNISLTDEDRDLLRELLTQIAQQDYDYEQMKETLERVEANMDELAAKQEADENNAAENAAQDAAEQAEQTETPETVAPDSILNQTNESALGDAVIIDATDPSTITTPETTAPQTETNSSIDIVSTDSYSDPNAEVPAENTDINAEAPVENTDVPAENVDVNVDIPAENTDMNAEAPDENVDGYIDLSGESSDISIDENGEAITLTPEETQPTDDTQMPEENAVAPITAADMTFAPATSADNGYTVYAAGQNELTVYFQRSDITAGTGMLAVNNSADGSIVETVNLNDTMKAAVMPMTDEELLEKGWGAGTKAVVYLSNPLAQSSSYYVTLTEDAFMTTDGASHSEAVTDASLWNIQTSEYGFAIDKTQSAGITAGMTVSGQIMMDGTAATYACIENADPSMVTFDMGEFTASGSFSATFNMPGKTTFQVSFYDAAGGNLLNTINYTVTVK